MDLNTFLVAQNGLSSLVGGFVLYIYFGFVTMLIAKRLGFQGAWLAWVPIANLYVMIKIAGLEWWWIFGFFVPFANLFIAAYVWSEIGKKLGKPWWVGAVVIIPLIGWLVPGYFAATMGTGDAPKSVDPLP